MANARVWIWQPLPSESLLFALWRWALTGWFHKWLATGCELLLFVLWCATVWWNKPNWLSLASAWFWLGICLALPRWLGWWSSLSVFVAALDLTIGFYSLAVETALWLYIVCSARGDIGLSNGHYVNMLGNALEFRSLLSIDVGLMMPIVTCGPGFCASPIPECHDTDGSSAAWWSAAVWSAHRQNA